VNTRRIRSRHGLAALGLLAAGSLLLSACGSDNTTGSSGGTSASAGAGPAVACGGKTNLTAEGSSAQKGAMDTFISAYEQACSGHNLSYNPTGSGAGVKQFNGGQVDFGGSDSPLNKTNGETDAAAKRCNGNPAWDLPMVFGPVAVGYKLNGVTDLTLDAPTLAKIFSGQVKTWNDPAIAGLNSGANLPSSTISVIYRSDDSGTTDNFQQYLGIAAKGGWTKGAGKKFAGGVGEGKQGSAGVAQAAAAVDGSITYIELSYAQDNKLSMAKIDNGTGAVALNDGTVGKSIDGAKVKGDGNDLVLDLNSIYGASTAGAYPLVLATYELVCSKGYDADTSKAVKAFLTTAATSAQGGLKDAGYAPLPTAFQQKLLTAVTAIG
jgi:phosphate transport system substrate-binding protein